MDKLTEAKLKKLADTFEELRQNYIRFEIESMDKFHGYNAIKYGAKAEAFSQAVAVVQMAMGEDND